jgi:hypothetical protein
VSQAAVPFLLNSVNVKLVRREVAWRDVHDINRIEWYGQCSDTCLERRRCFGRETPAQHIFNSEAKNRQRLVDRGRNSVISRIEAQRPIAGGQQNQATPKSPLTQRITPVGSHHIEPQHDSGAAYIL